ncbi:DUF4395 domain-containing protein [Actinotalea sp.]|uniref:DUF4395 domain-containing protein n=1 Tax=Actinotalea sp. TaxID=1872145 RepID=UPI003567F0D6
MSTPEPTRSSASVPRPRPDGIDPRGPRFSAGLTAVLLTVVLFLDQGTPALVLLLVVVALFVSGVVRGPAGSVTGLAFRRWVQPRLRPTRDREDPRPPRFAQTVGLVITGTGALLALIGIPAAIPVAASIALVAAFLNAAFGFCLGCEMYLLGRRVLTRA